jgi:hypothetical protein
MKKFFALGFMALLALGIASLGISQDVNEQSCQQTLKNNCTTCHGLKKICNKLDQTNTNWKVIVTNMGQKGKLSQEVQNTVFTCLTTTTEPKKMVCDN